MIEHLQYDVVNHYSNEKSQVCPEMAILMGKPRVLNSWFWGILIFRRLPNGMFISVRQCEIAHLPTGLYIQVEFTWTSAIRLTAVHLAVTMLALPDWNCGDSPFLPFAF